MTKYSDQFVDNGATTLVTAITTTPTAGTQETINVVDTTTVSGYPQVPEFRIKIDAEVMLVVGVVDSTHWAVLRGWDHTVPLTHAASAPITSPISSGILEMMQQVKVARGAYGDGIHDDTAAIQQALDEIHNQWGAGILYLPEGTFAVSAGSIPSGARGYYSLASYGLITMRGAGMGKTTIKMLDGNDGGGIFVYNTQSDFGIEDLTLDGQKTLFADTGTDGAQCGLYATSQSRIRANRARFTNWLRQGSYLSVCTIVKMDQCINDNNGREGLESDSNAACDIVACDAYSNGRSGVHVVGGATLNVNSHSTRVLGGKQWSNGMSGVHMEYQQGGAVIGVQSTLNSDEGVLVTSCNGVAVRDSYVAKNLDDGVKLLHSDNSQVTACTIQDNSTSGGLKDAINNDGSSSCLIVGNRCYDDQVTKTQQYGYHETASASYGDYNLVNGNHFRGNVQAAGYALGTGTHNVVGTNLV